MLIKNLIADHWIIEWVDHDGVEQPEWKGLEFSIEQTADSSGNYSLVQTPYDTIWQSAGIWKLGERKSEIYFDDDRCALFHVENNELILETTLPCTSTPCLDFPCTLIVTGNWYFRLKRK